MLDTIVGKLKDLKVGQVLADPKSLRRYSHDMSIYQIQPRAVVIPSGLEEISKTIHFATAAGVTVTPRGGGSGTAGSALGGGIVIAAPRDGFLSNIKILQQDSESIHFVAGAGTYHAEVQRTLKDRGFFLPADPSSSAICQIGGNISTKASGPHALKYGAITKYLAGLEFISDQGEFVSTKQEQSIPERFTKTLASIQKKISQDQYSVDFLMGRRNLKSASGYNLNAFLGNHSVGTLISQLFAGSVGTLGFVSQAYLRGIPYYPERGTMLLCFKNLREAVEASGMISKKGVAAVELISRQTIQVIARTSKKKIPLSEDGHVLLVEFEGQGLQSQINTVEQLVNKSGLVTSKPVIADSVSQADNLWKLRKKILPLLSNPGPHLKALSVVNDVGVPPDNLANFIEDLESVFARFGLESVVYGHAGSGNLHLRPIFDLQSKGIKKTIRQLADEVYELVFKYNGTISGEHGMGRLRAPYLEREWGTTLHGYMREVKEVFDPGKVFNPDVMFTNYQITDNMRDDL